MNKESTFAIEETYKQARVDTIQELPHTFKKHNYGKGN